MLKDVFVFMFIFLGDVSFNYFCWWKKKLWEHVCLRKKTSNIPSRVFNVKKKCMCTCVRARYLKKNNFCLTDLIFFLISPTKFLPVYAVFFFLRLSWVYLCFLLVPCSDRAIWQCQHKRGIFYLLNSFYFFFNQFPEQQKVCHYWFYWNLHSLPH